MDQIRQMDLGREEIRAIYQNLVDAINEEEEAAIGLIETFRHQCAKKKRDNKIFLSNDENINKAIQCTKDEDESSKLELSPPSESED